MAEKLNDEERVELEKETLLEDFANSPGGSNLRNKLIELALDSYLEFLEVPVESLSSVQGQALGIHKVLRLMDGSTSRKEALLERARHRYEASLAEERRRDRLAAETRFRGVSSMLG